MTIETEIANLTSQTTALLSSVNVAKTTLDARVTAATTQAVIVTTARDAAIAQAAQAAIYAAQAAIYAAQAQATNPDSPIRINPRKIAADFTLGSAYNAQSTGPITISDGVTVTVQDNATYAIQ